MPHPAYNPDPAALDYYLFQSMAHFPYLWHFYNPEDVEVLVKEFFASKDKNLCYRHKIKELAER